MLPDESACAPFAPSWRVEELLAGALTALES
jgi:hypothetical protein